MRYLLLLLLAIGMVAASPAQIERGAPLERKGAIGVQFAPATAEELKAAGQPGPLLKVVRVLPGLTGEKIDLRANDLLSKLGGVAVTASAQIGPLARTFSAGKPIEIEVFREGKLITLRGPLVERPRQKEEGMEVIYDQVVSQGKRIRVITTHPTGKGPFPTVFLIGGIGAYSIDGPFASTPYGNVLAPLAREGYAIVRVDKPGQGDSEGPEYTSLLFDDEFDAYKQALKLIKTYEFVNPKKIAIFGHSMGGTFGPLLAAEEPVAGVAVHGTLAKTWIEYVLENSRRQSTLGGATAEQVDVAMRELSALSHYLYNLGLSPKEIKEKYPEMAAAIDGMIPDGKTYSGVGLPFFQQLAKKNVMGAWAKTNARVLAIHGENDFISGAWDHQFIADSVNALRPGTAKYVSLPQSDHGFFQTESPRDSMMKWGRGGTPINPNIVETLRDWLKDVFKDQAG